jgi:cell division initiation protein
METPPPPPSTLETLRTVEFRLGLKGYNVDEVDEYLEKAAVEAEALQEQFRQVNERLRQASERIAQLDGERREAPAPQAAAAAPPPDDALQRTLLLAQKFVDQAKRESEAEAAELVAQAEDKARSTVAQAEEKARQLSTDADRRLREEVTRLEGMRGQLASDVENMASHLEAERTRLRTSLSEVLRWVEEHIQPASALMALRQEAKADEGEPPRPPQAAPRPPQAPPAQGQLATDGNPPAQRNSAPPSEVKVAGGTPAEPS